MTLKFLLTLKLPIVGMGKTGRGVGDRWIKLRDWELGDHVIHNKCFASIYLLL